MLDIKLVQLKLLVILFYPRITLLDGARLRMPDCMEDINCQNH